MSEGIGGSWRAYPYSILASLIPVFLYCFIHTLSCLMLIHSCLEVVEVCLGCGSVGLHALFGGCVPMEDLGVVGFGDVGRNTLSGEVLLGSSGS